MEVSKDSKFGVAKDSTDNILTGVEIYKMNSSNVDFVALSACDTGVSASKDFQQLMGMQQMFKRAGVQSVLYTLWEVDDKSIAEFMVEFYSGWIDGLTRHEAFLKAQQKIKAQYVEPYYWAGFVLID